MPYKIPVPEEILDELVPVFGDEVIVERFLADVDCSDDEDEEHSVWVPLKRKKETPLKQKEGTKAAEMTKKTQQVPVQTATLDKFLKLTQTVTKEPKSGGPTRGKNHDLSDSGSNNGDNDEVPTPSVSFSQTDAIDNSTMLDTSSWNSETWYQKLRKKFISDCLDEIEFDTESKEFFFAEDLDEDSEVYVIQCPKDMDPKLLEGQKLNLDGETSLLHGDEHFQSLSERGGGDRRINLVLPSRESKQFKMVSHPLAGSIVITESMDVPNIEEEPHVPQENFSLPEVVLEKLRTSFSENTLIESFCEEGSKKKKKKKHAKVIEPVIPEELVTAPASTIEDECSGRKKKKKKKKHSEDKDEDEVQPQLYISDVSSIQDFSMTKKAKKKRKEHSENEPSENVPQFHISDISAIEDCSVIKKKKKKNKNKDQENHDSFVHGYDIQLQSTTVQSDSISGKKKKKKEDNASDVSLGHNLVNDYSRAKNRKNALEKENTKTIKEHFRSETSNSVLENEVTDREIHGMGILKKNIKREREDDGYGMALYINSSDNDFVTQVTKKIKKEIVSP